MDSKKVICDTDVMIDYWDDTKGRHAATVFQIDNNIGIDNVVLSAITKLELLAGTKNKREMNLLSSKLNRFNIALINDEITIKALDMFQLYFLSHNLSIPDCIIGSTSLVTGLELFTYNTKDFKFITELRLYK